MNFHRVFEQVFTLETAMAGAVFAVVFLLFGFAVVRRRARWARAPSPRATSTRLEWAYVVLLAGVAGFLVYFTASANGRETRSQAPATLPSAPPPVPVAVNAFQWCWEFRYADAPVTVTGACEQGRYPTVVVPAGRPVEFRLASRDVVHSFWIPALNAKMDAFPDHVNNLTMTFDQPGEWLGRCAEYCGTYHTTMDFHIRAVPPEEYQRWLQQHRSAA